MLEKFDAIQHKAGTDPKVTFIAVETVATGGNKRRCAVSDMVVTVRTISVLPADYNNVLDLMRYSAGNDISRA